MILVTGGTGMLGAHLLFDLLKKEQRVRAIKRSGSTVSGVEKIFSFYTSSPQNLMERIDWVEADMLDYFAVEEALTGVDSVYHCAAMVSFNPHDKERMIQSNVQGTGHIVNACLHLGIKKMAHVSSIAALGRAGKDQMTTEKTPWKDSDKDSPYSISKYRSELEVWRGMAEGLNAVIINPSVILGPGDWSKGSPSFFPLIKKGMKFYSEATNGYVGVRDVSRIMIQLMDSHISGERFVVNAEDLTYLELFNMIAKSVAAPYPSIEAKAWMLNLGWRLAKIQSLVTGKAPQFTRSTARSFLNSHQYSSQKLTEATGFEFTAMQKVIGDIGEIYLKDLS
jgi:nucleoside-diphosphate-sugar epimerase